MNGEEKRRYLRIGSKNLVSYVCIGDTGETMSHGMGRTLNVNETGILLETVNPIDIGCNMSLAIGLKDHVFNIAGDIIHQSRGQDGRYRHGIKFRKMDGAHMEFLKRFIVAFKTPMAVD